MKKRFLALLLCMAMCLPTIAYAVTDPLKHDDGTKHTFTSFAEDGSSTCDVCGCGAQFTINPTSLDYAGASKPMSFQLIVYVNGTQMAKDGDYTVQSTVNSNTTQATVSLVGVTYTGTYTKKFNIVKATPTIAWRVEDYSVDYTGNMVSRNVIINRLNISAFDDLSSSIIFNYRKQGVENWSAGLPINAGEYEIKAKIPSSDNYNEAETDKYLKLTVAQIAQEVEPPEVLDLYYNTEPQNLVRSTIPGMMYSMEKNGTYTTKVPQETDVGIYTVWFKAPATENYAEADGRVAAEIKQRECKPTVTLSQYSYTYDGEEKKPAVTVKDGTHIIPDTEYYASYNDNQSPGTAVVTIRNKDGGNYLLQTVSVNYEITDEVYKPLQIINQPSKVYYGDTFTLATKEGPSKGDVEWSVENGSAIITQDGKVTITGHGPCTIKATKGGKSPNYWSFNIERRNVTVTVVAKDKQYDGSRDVDITASITSGLVAGDTIQVSGLSGRVNNANAGSNKQVSVLGSVVLTGDNADHYNPTVAGGAVTCNITKAQARILQAPTARTLRYNGGSQALVNPGTSNMEGDVIEYSLSQTSNFKATIPTGQDVGEYTVYYRIQETTNYTGVAVQSVRVRILNSDGSMRDTVEEPSITINADQTITCTPVTVEVSENRTDWKSVRTGSSLSSSWYGKTVYFRSPASNGLKASDYISVYIKDKQNNPTGKLELTSNSYSVTITNARSLSGLEFSIDGKTYSSKTSWTNLVPDTQYTVYARVPGTSSKFPSAPISANIKTAVGAKTNIEYNKVSTANTVYMQAEGTVQFNVSGTTMSAGFTASDVQALKNDIKTNSRKTTVVTTLDVNIVQEETDYRNYNRIQYTMPGDMGLLQLRFHSPWFTVKRDIETTSVTLEEGIIGGTQQLKNWAAGESHVFRVTCNNKNTGAGAVTIAFPWEWPDRADLDGLKVVWTSDGKTSKTIPYSVVGSGIQFVLPDSGYFYIHNLMREYGKMPFTDSQTHWAYSYIQHAYETGLVSGYDHNTFGPNDKLTRSQYAVLMARLRGWDGSSYGSVPYTDVKPGQWYYNAISYCYACGVLKPTGDEFKPNEPITRADAVAWMEAMFPYDGVLWTPFYGEDRDQIPTYALHAVDAMYTCGIISGTSAKTFSPLGELTRAEIVTILYRMQTADYWQNTRLVHPLPLDKSKVKSSPNIWLDDQLKKVQSKETSDLTAALQEFQNLTGVRPYVVTTKSVGTNSDVDDYAERIYNQKFTDNGHLVFAWYEKSSADDPRYGVYAGSDARTIIGVTEEQMLIDLFKEYNAMTDMTSGEALAKAFRQAGSDIMSMTRTNSNWKQPAKPVTATSTSTTTVQPKDVVKAHTFNWTQTNDLWAAVKSQQVPENFKAYVDYDGTWKVSEGTRGVFVVQLFHTNTYQIIRFTAKATETMNVDVFKDYFGMGLNEMEFFAAALTAGTDMQSIRFVDKATGSYLYMSVDGSVHGEILIGAPKDVISTQLQKYGM